MAPGSLVITRPFTLFAIYIQFYYFAFSTFWINNILLEDNQFFSEEIPIKKYCSSTFQDTIVKIVVFRWLVFPSLISNDHIHSSISLILILSLKGYSIKYYKLLPWVNIFFVGVIILVYGSLKWSFTSYLKAILCRSLFLPGLQKAGFPNILVLVNPFL